MNKILVASILILIIIVSGAIYLLNSKSDTNVDNSNTNTDSGNVKTFVIDSSHLRFYMNRVENPDLVVKEGDKVRIEFTSSEGFHDWRLDEFNAATEKVNPGNITSVEFIADKKGAFEYYCSVGQHRANGMKGKFIVE